MRRGPATVSHERRADHRAGEARSIVDLRRLRRRPDRLSAAKLPRDSRVDALRGLALLMIFIDHVPGNRLGLLTLRNFGFSDAAELFVLLSGFSSLVAFGGNFDRNGFLSGIGSLALRCARIYAHQAALLLIVLVVASAWMRYFDLQPLHGGSYVHSGLRGLRHGLTLAAQPNNLNILPLYIVLLGSFPLVYLLVRLNPIGSVLLSAALWFAVNLDPSINLTNWMDGRGWFFDPFAWQLLFVIGAVGAVLLRNSGGDLPVPVWLRVVAWGYLGFALVVAAPWASWGWLGFHPIVIGQPDKTILAPLRLANVLAFAALIFSSAKLRTMCATPALQFLVVCGRHSLEVFSLGTLLAMLVGWFSVLSE